MTVFYITNRSATTKVVSRSAYKEAMRTLNLRNMRQEFRVKTVYLGNTIIKHLTILGDADLRTKARNAPLSLDDQIAAELLGALS